MNANEMRAKESDELQVELERLLKDQFKLRMQKGTGQLGRPDHFKKVRRSIARVKTILAEKKQVSGNE